MTIGGEGKWELNFPPVKPTQTIRQLISCRKRTTDEGSCFADAAEPASPQKEAVEEMTTNRERSILNIQSQLAALGLPKAPIKFESEKMSNFGVGFRFESDRYSPDIGRFYGREIEKIDETDLIYCYAIAFGSIPAHLISKKGEQTTFTLVPEKEGITDLSPNNFYCQESRRRAVKVSCAGEFIWTGLVGNTGAYLFRPHKESTIEVRKELVWGCAIDDDWEFYSEWHPDPNIDPNYSEWNGTAHCYAKQANIWSAVVSN